MRRKWTQDYEERFSPDGRSYYAYTGRRFQLTEEGRRTCAARELPLLALSIAVLAAMGLIESPGSRTMYVVLPWAAVCIPSGIALFDLIRVLLTRRALTARDHAYSAVRLSKSLFWMTTLTALLSVCDLMFLILKGFSIREGAFFLFSLVNLALALAARHANGTVIWKEISP